MHEISTKSQLGSGERCQWSIAACWPSRLSVDEQSIALSLVALQSVVASPAEIDPRGE